MKKFFSTGDLGLKKLYPVKTPIFSDFWRFLKKNVNDRQKLFSQLVTLV